MIVTLTSCSYNTIHLECVGHVKYFFKKHNYKSAIIYNNFIRFFISFLTHINHATIINQNIDNTSR